MQKRYGRTATINCGSKALDADQFPIVQEVIAYAKATKLFDAADTRKKIDFLKHQKERILAGSNDIEELREEIKHLKRTLEGAHHVIAHLATKDHPIPSGPDGSYVLLSPMHLKSSDDWMRWQDDVIDRVINLAKVENGRAYCPLCGGGTTPWGSWPRYEEKERGFQFPMGLEMHLKGSHRAHQCMVMEIVIELADDRTKFRIADIEKQMS
jgi:hypothetical protein